MTRSERFEILRSFFGEPRDYNRYYNGVSVFYRSLEFLFLILFTVFLLVSVFGSLTGISYENAEYVIRNFELRLESNKTVCSEFIYSPDKNQSFASFDGGLITAGNSGVSIFSETGTSTCTYYENFTSPVVRAGEKYALVFENGGTEYCIFNRFSRVYSGTSAYPIRNAGICDSGDFWLISSAEGYTSALYVYDSDFNESWVYRSASHIVCAELNSDGSAAVIATLDIDTDGQYLCNVIKTVSGSLTPEMKVVKNSVFPLDIRFTDSGFVLICSDRVIFYGNSSSPHEILTGIAPADFDVRGDCCLLLFAPAGDEPVYSCALVTPQTDSLSCTEISSQYCSVCALDSGAAVLTDSDFYLFDGNTLKPLECSKPTSSETQLVYAGNDTVFLAGKAAAYAVSTGEKE